MRWLLLVGCVVLAGYGVARAARDLAQWAPDLADDEDLYSGESE